MPLPQIIVKSAHGDDADGRNGARMGLWDVHEDHPSDLPHPQGGNQVTVYGRKVVRVAQTPNVNAAMARGDIVAASEDELREYEEYHRKRMSEQAARVAQNTPTLDPAGVVAQITAMRTALTQLLGHDPLAAEQPAARSEATRPARDATGPRHAADAARSEEVASEQSKSSKEKGGE